MQRYASIVRVKDGQLEEYVELHNQIWPAVIESNHAANIQNYSIFHLNGWLFSYYEYKGTDFVADLKRKQENPITQQWQALTSSFFEPWEDEKTGESWKTMQEIFHFD